MSSSPVIRPQMELIPCTPPHGSSSYPPSPLSWEVPAHTRLPPPRFCALPPAHGLPRPKPLYPSTSTRSASESLQSVSSIDGTQEGLAFGTAAGGAAALAQDASGVGAGRTAATRSCMPGLSAASASAQRLAASAKKPTPRIRDTFPRRDHEISVFGRLQAVDNLRAHSELGALAAKNRVGAGSGQHKAAGISSVAPCEFRETQESRSYTCLGVNAWVDLDEFDEFESNSHVGREPFAPRSLRDFDQKQRRNHMEDKLPAHLPHGKKRMSLRQLVREQAQMTSKLRWMKVENSFDAGLDTQVDSSGPITWGRSIPRFFPRMRRR